MKAWLEAPLAAVRQFTRLPVPGWVGHDDEVMARAVRFLPAIGLIVGAIGATVTALAALALPATLAVALGMMATVLLTGGFHEDGFADACDGFGGGRDKAQVLAIMKDARIGSYAAIGLCLLLLTKWNALMALQASWGPYLLAPALLAAHAVSRLAALAVMAVMDYARTDDSSRSRQMAQRPGGRAIVFAAVVGLAPCIVLPWRETLVALGIVIVLTGLAVRLFARRIGGYTGDCLGAVQQVTELGFYLGLACSFS